MTRIFHEEITDPRFTTLLQNSNVYQWAELDDCDYVLHEHLLWDLEGKTLNRELDRISLKYLSSGKLVIVLLVSDYEKKCVLPSNLLLVRTSARASMLRANEFVMPYVWDCFSDPFPPKRVETQAQIGFCGFGSKVRKRILDAFRQSGQVKSNFVIREKFWGGKPFDGSLMEEFNRNLEDNPFVIAQRGRGNFSIRFYQALSAGRIPVLVDTDLAFPFADQIDWAQYVVMGKNEQDCIQKVVEAFESGRYLEMQQEGGAMFRKYFSNECFFEQLLLQIHRGKPTEDKSRGSIFRLDWFKKWV